MKKRRTIAVVVVVLIVAGSAAVYASQKCFPCDGSGRITHNACRGTGKSSGYTQKADGSRVYYNCNRCHGSGQITCPRCGGSGYQ